MLSNGTLKLNVLLTCYNQTDYIEECVRSILMQKVDFEYNVIVADDCSTDDTLEKIQKLAYGSKIDFIYLANEKNLGINENYDRAFASCDGEYVAVMEGDDFWTDPKRLQKHINFLDNHHECSMSSNNRINAKYEEARFNVAYTNAVLQYAEVHDRYKDADNNEYVLINAHDVIQYGFGSNFSTCVYRKSFLGKLPPGWFSRERVGDFLTNVAMCAHGLMCYFLDVMTVYRIHEKGLWSGKSYREQLQFIADATSRWDELTNKKFSESFALKREKVLEERDMLDHAEQGSPGCSIKQKTYLTNQLNELNAQLESIYNSRTWKVGKIFQRVYRFFTPTRK